MKRTITTLIIAILFYLTLDYLTKLNNSIGKGIIATTIIWAMISFACLIDWSAKQADMHRVIE